MEIATNYDVNNIESNNIVSICSNNIVSSEDDEVESSKKKIKSIREKVNKNKLNNANKMILKHDHKRNKKTIEYKVGDAVTVRIPDVDRGGSEFRRFPAKIFKISGEKEQFFELVTPYGTLNDKLRACDFQPFSGIVDCSLIEAQPVKISIREVAIKFANRNLSIKEIKTICNCNGICFEDNRCKCYKNKKKLHFTLSFKIKK